MSSWTRAFTDEGSADAGQLGGKGAGLLRMTRDGLRVPPGLVAPEQLPVELTP